MTCSRVINIVIFVIHLVALIINAITTFGVGWVNVGDGTIDSYLGVYNYCASTLKGDDIKKNEITCMPYGFYYDKYVDFCMDTVHAEIDFTDYAENSLMKFSCEEKKSELKENGFPPEGIKNMRPLATLGFVSSVFFILFFYISTVSSAKSIPRFFACTSIIAANVLGALAMGVCKDQVLDSQLAYLLTHGSKGTVDVGYHNQSGVCVLYGVVLIVYVISWFITPKPRPQTSVVYTQMVTQAGQPLTPLKVVNNYNPKPANYNTQPANYVNPQGFTQPLLSTSNNGY